MKIWSGKLGVEPAASRLSIDCSDHAELFPVVLLTLRAEPRARFELAFPDYKAGASPTMLTGPVILEPMERIERSSVAYRELLSHCATSAEDAFCDDFQLSKRGIERHLLGGRPLLEVGMLFQDGQVTSRAS
jgi:hypothetical protein